MYLNQLMSFAAVTAPALLALQQTGTFNEQLQQLGKATIAFFSIPVQAGWCQAAFGVFCCLYSSDPDWWFGVSQLIVPECDSVTPCHGVISSLFFLMLNIYNHFVISVLQFILYLYIIFMKSVSENSNLPLWHFGL